MGNLRKYNEATFAITFFMADSSDHIAGKTGLSPTVTISKDAGSFASPSGAVSEIGNGWYKIAANATDVNTVGELIVHATAAGADPTDTKYEVVQYHPNNPEFQANIKKIGDLDISNDSAVLKANLTQIDGAATNGYNATLNLAALRIRSTNQAAVQISVASAPSGTSGVIIESYGSAAPLRLYGADGSSNSLVLDTGAGTGKIGGHLNGNVSGSVGSVSGNVSGNVTGSVGSLATQAKADVNAEVNSALNTAIPGSPTAGSVNAVLAALSAQAAIRPTKNTGYNNFMFPMFDATTKQPKTGLTVAAYRAIDGNPFALCSNSVVELGSGVYRISLSSSDLNGDKIMFRFTATGADDQLVEILTQG